MSFIVIKHYPKFKHEKNAGVEIGFGHKTLTYSRPSPMISQEEATRFAQNQVKFLNKGELLYLIDDQKKETLAYWYHNQSGKTIHQYCY